MPKVIKIKKGLNIKLKGKAEKILEQAERPDLFAVKPPDFEGIMPKLINKQGSHVDVGSPLFFDKYHQNVVFTSPVSGTVSTINRGERRRILEVVIEADQKDNYIEFGKADPLSLTRQQIIDKLLKSGLWPYIRQRPYGVIANPEDNPKAIHISGFDTAPLASDPDFLVSGQEQDFQTGINVLSQLTDGKIHLNLNVAYPPSKVFTGADKVQLNYFQGPHPAGSVGVQIHHIDPINKGDIVWYAYPQDIIMIGRLFEHGIYDPTRIIALTGSEVENPRYYRTANGASIKPLTSGNIKSKNVRCISGNVLTGSKINANGYLGFYDSQITIIPEGDHYEMFGWAKPGINKFSHSSAFLSALFPKEEYVLDTNLNGGRRAYVMTGQYEKVTPMDIFPVQLIKAIMVEDIDLMENLGIYEVTEEDLALCEFVCTSKVEVQSILREGLNLIRKETE